MPWKMTYVRIDTGAVCTGIYMVSPAITISRQEMADIASQFFNRNYLHYVIMSIEEVDREDVDG